MLIKRKSVEREESQRKTRKPVFAPVNLSEDNGVRYLHFGTQWIQGAMRIRKPDWIELEYVQQMMAWMLFIEKPSHIVQLGLGTAALTKFCYRHFPTTHVTAIELDPTVIAVCHSMFKLPQNDERLQVLEMDAQDFVEDSTHYGKIDVIQADLYDAGAAGPVLDTSEFYLACADCLTPNGIMTVNLFGDHPSYEKNLRAMRFAFDKVLCLPEVPAGNVVAIAFKQAPKLDFGLLYERAFVIAETTGLPARLWVSGLKSTQEG
jgi:spermidine synthase